MNKNLHQSINLLKDLVKESHIKGQMHIDFSLAPAQKIEHYKEALIVCRAAITNEEMTESKFKEYLGI